MNRDLESIIECEKKYTQCFCECHDEEGYYRYIDDKLKDMYDHNFISLKTSMESNELQKLISNEIEKRIKDNIDFFKIQIGQELPKNIPIDNNGKKPEIEHNGIYQYKLENVSHWNSIKECSVKKTIDESMVNELIQLDLISDEKMCGKDFCIRRAKRTGEVFLSDEHINLYICYFKGQPVGSCELFITDNIAKIESFTIIPEYQRKGIGTTLLKYLMNEALKSNAKIIYLVADEDDTPKEMYLKLGFEKQSDLYSLFWKLK